MLERHDTVVIGGGQAGLAMSYHLQHRGREHIIIEKRLWLRSQMATSRHNTKTI